MIEIYLLEQFDAFARCGTLLAASEELHITQPTLSRSMKKLEDEFGVSLFHRENSKLSLNETGKLAAEYARRALEANQEMIDRVVMFDRSLRTVSLGSCAPFPVNELMPTLQEQLPGKTLSSELLSNDEQLLKGLRNHLYQLVILHENPEDKTLYCQRYLEEKLYITVPEDHPLAIKQSVTFDELKGFRILMTSAIGFWMGVTLKHLSESDLLIQTSTDALAELIDASNLPFFNSDQMMKAGVEIPGRISLPITDGDAHATFWLACLASEQLKYRSLFSAIRGTMLRSQ
ncbi:MAG: LysR family transcriptional regulator [Lachnospiraceae bacterium]|nr:LysR family transcriptional regulator [Lachnospiraceae bacterium]